MVDIGITQPIIVPVQASVPQAVPETVNTAPLPAPLPHEAIPDQVSYDVKAAEQKRADAVQQLSQQAANNYVLGDQEFVIFKDATGQYITRFTSLRDGKVTYIPEPTLYKIGNGSSSIVNLRA